MIQPAKRKRIPYGMMNFIDVREDDCYYVDKTHYIPLIENANKYFFYIRPRRFGKSLTISMLHHYYNILEADKFERWYGDLYIGKHPTPERNSYLIIYLNFAVVNAELKSYRQSLDAHCNTEFNFFCDIYAQYLPEGIKEDYCFADKSYGSTTMYNSNMVLYFVDNYIRNEGNMPRNMIEENIRVDYNKLRMLIRKDKEFAHDASTIQTLVQQGYVTGELKTGFPAEAIAEPDNFVSLLFYFGMLTISGTKQGETLLTIPNQVVREQLYSYLLDTYNEANLRFDNWEKGKLASAMAYRGDWKAYFDYIAECLHRYSSQRDRQKGEAYVHGFTLAMTAQNRFYRPISEQDNQEGYADIFMFPLLEIYKDMLHSYIIELKYAKGRIAMKKWSNSAGKLSRKPNAMLPVKRYKKQ